MESVRVLLKPDVKHQRILRLESDKEETKEWRNTDFTLVFPDKPYISTWKSQDSQTIIKFLRDPLREVRYYFLTGTNLAHHVGIIRQRLATFERADVDVLMSASGSWAEKVHAVYTAAFAAPTECDPQILDFLSRALTDEAADVRRTAIDAALVVAWHELRLPLERVAAEDTDEDLREFAKETLERLQGQVWGVVRDPSAFGTEPLPPDPRRVRPLLGRPGYAVADHASAWVGVIPSQQQPVVKKTRFSPPTWLLSLCKQGDWGGVHWYTAKQIREASVPPPPSSEMLLPNEPQYRERDEALLARMVSVGDGPQLQDRTQRVETSRLYIDRDNPGQLLLSLALKHPPTLWVPAGQSRETVDAVLAAYLFPGMPAQETLPFQKRLFLTTTSMLRDDFRAVENCLARSAFCDSLIWGSNNPTDPYPEQVTLGRIPLPDLRRYLAQAPGVLPRTSIRTRFSRSIIQVIDFQDGYFADLFFRPTPNTEWGADYNARYKTDFPISTPIDVIVTLGQFACIDADRIRPQAAATEDPDQREGIEKIIAFLEQKPESETPTNETLVAKLNRLRSASGNKLSDADIAGAVIAHAKGRPIPDKVAGVEGGAKVVAELTQLLAIEGGKSDAAFSSMGMLLSMVQAGKMTFEEAFMGTK